MNCPLPSPPQAAAQPATATSHRITIHVAQPPAAAPAARARAPFTETTVPSWPSAKNRTFPNRHFHSSDRIIYAPLLSVGTQNCSYTMFELMRTILSTGRCLFGNPESLHPQRWRPVPSRPVWHPPVSHRPAWHRPGWHRLAWRRPNCCRLYLFATGPPLISTSPAPLQLHRTASCFNSRGPPVS